MDIFDKAKKKNDLVAEYGSIEREARLAYGICLPCLKLFAVESIAFSRGKAGCLKVGQSRAVG